MWILARAQELGKEPGVAALHNPGFTALHVAIMRRDEKMVSALLAHGADPNTPLRTWTPTRRSSHDFHFEPVLVGATPFWLAARFTQPGVMRLLVKHGADPLFVHHSNYVTGGRYEERTEVTTVLMAAAGMGGGTAWVQPAGGKEQMAQTGFSSCGIRVLAAKRTIADLDARRGRLPMKHGASLRRVSSGASRWGASV